MTKRLTMLAVVVTVFGCMAYAASSSLVGVVSDSSCGAQHSQASAAAASCVKSCVAGGGKYVLVSQGKVYQVTPQGKFAQYPGQEVRVRGKISGRSIAVTSVTPAHNGDPQKSAAKSSSGNGW
ncbi:MAG: DUF5818 domain-containing protein [Terriglobia bacterium]